MATTPAERHNFSATHALWPEKNCRALRPARRQKTLNYPGFSWIHFECVEIPSALTSVGWVTLYGFDRGTFGPILIWPLVSQSYHNVHIGTFGNTLRLPLNMGRVASAIWHKMEGASAPYYIMVIFSGAVCYPFFVGAGRV